MANSQRRCFNLFLWCLGRTISLPQLQGLYSVHQAQDLWQILQWWLFVVINHCAFCEAHASWETQYFHRVHSNCMQINKVACCYFALRLGSTLLFCVSVSEYVAAIMVHSQHWNLIHFLLISVIWTQGQI